MEHRFYHAPGFAKREEQRKEKPARQSYTIGRTAKEEEEYSKKAAQAADKVKQQRREWFHDPAQLKLRPPLAKKGSAQLEREMQEPAERRHYLASTLLRPCFAANITMRAIGSIVDWVRSVGQAGYFNDHGMLPSYESLRVNVLPQQKKEERQKVRAWVKWYASQGERHIPSLGRGGVGPRFPANAFHC